MPDVSAIICTHNPREAYLARVLAALAAQTLSRDSWELLIIDNASTVPLSGNVDLSFHPHGRIIREEALGLTNSRLRGIRESTRALLVFVDDDNVIASDYLEQASNIARQWSILGVWGGQAFPEWEEVPADWTREYWPWLGLRELDREYWSNAPRDSKTLPFGAGMCLRRDIAVTYADSFAHNPQRRLLVGRTGLDLAGSEDTDIAFMACGLGRGVGLFPQLKMTHLIPRQRVQEEYLLRLIEALTHSGGLLDWMHGGTGPIRAARSQRLLRWYQSFFISERARRFDRATQRGREAARRTIASFGNRASQP